MYGVSEIVSYDRGSGLVDHPVESAAIMCDFDAKEMP